VRPTNKVCGKSSLGHAHSLKHFTGGCIICTFVVCKLRLGRGCDGCGWFLLSPCSWLKF